ncbi:Flp pilus assembly complex ATPase component [Candidatus Falkowbacteria bacterium]|uniref:Bacterial type II secretion system protein E domain-containing protein n=1 Tax=Candidatus Falkowbacteria bacterium CG10_big_fil_rev_8_21_14_0_10_37_18 TaxID=1974562 RepID=A0A2H0VB18_9BACT|nr:Flp pilus assembly complex ATPase component [Candidatus Falkowbacteria bacterium]NCQ12574.1 Flp pilus assembly complex ATPase component [Candidatus Falkowbacteria bacterium]PIR95559.1 MAG: hypothetical protein COT93_02000 [Candidatus Falkowbacteria bacterium CG10_big_fil_rev_8_21_14_0_10_37_18]
MSKKIVNNIFHYAHAEGASGLVITSQKDRVALHYNFPNEIRRDLSFPKKLEKSFLENLRQILGLTEGELLAKKYYKINDPKFRLNFYLSVLPAAEGEKIIIDIIRRSTPTWYFKQLGLQTTDRQKIEKTIRRGRGLIVISAPAGNGKSATLHAILSDIKQTDKNIYLFDKEVKNTEKAKNISASLAGINYLNLNIANWNKIRQHDVDIIAVDDCDEKNMLTEAIQVATSGRLVIITLTAPDSLSTLNKIFKIQLPLRLKLDTLKLIINQKLVPLKKSRLIKSGLRQNIGIFETFSLSKKIKKFLLDSKEKDLTATKFQERLQARLLKEDWPTLETDRQKKTRAGIL